MGRGPSAGSSIPTPFPVTGRGCLLSGCYSWRAPFLLSSPPSLAHSGWLYAARRGLFRDRAPGPDRPRIKAYAETKALLDPTCRQLISRTSLIATPDDTHRRLRSTRVNHRKWEMGTMRPCLRCPHQGSRLPLQAGTCICHAHQPGGLSEAGRSSGEHHLIRQSIRWTKLTYIPSLMAAKRPWQGCLQLPFMRMKPLPCRRLSGFPN